MNTPTPDQLDFVKQELEHWCNSRPRKGKMPIYLWAMVKPLMDEYQISMISLLLGLSLSQLKQNVIEQSISFVEAIS
jgi:hypothetical protein